MRNHTYIPLTVGCFSLLLAGHVAFGGDATITCTTPNNDRTISVAVMVTYPDGNAYVVHVDIEPGTDAPTKANKIAQAVDDNPIPNFSVDNSDPTDATFTITNLPAGTVVRFYVSGTGEANDYIEVDKIEFAMAEFGNDHYIAFDPSGQPAIFTTGIVTDIGELTAWVSAVELNYQTEGPIVCQALFQRLAPFAPAYGADILYAGDRLLIYYDPAFTQDQGGVIFGTTSPSPGCVGEAAVAESSDCNGNGIPDEDDIAAGISPDCNGNYVPDECDVASGNGSDDNGNGIPDECEVHAGDLNCDGAVNFGDINPFVQYLSDFTGWQAMHAGCPPENGDINGDGEYPSFGDINPFVALLAGS